MSAPTSPCSPLLAPNAPHQTSHSPPTPIAHQLPHVYACCPTPAASHACTAPEHCPSASPPQRPAASSLSSFPATLQYPSTAQIYQSDSPNPSPCTELHDLWTQQSPSQLHISSPVLCLPSFSTPASSQSSSNFRTIHLYLSKSAVPHHAPVSCKAPPAAAAHRTMPSPLYPAHDLP